MLVWDISDKLGYGWEHRPHSTEAHPACRAGQPSATAIVPYLRLTGHDWTMVDPRRTRPYPGRPIARSLQALPRTRPYNSARLCTTPPHGPAHICVFFLSFFFVFLSCYYFSIFFFRSFSFSCFYFFVSNLNNFGNPDIFRFQTFSKFEHSKNEYFL